VPVPELIQAKINLLESRREREKDILQTLIGAANVEKVSAGEWKWAKQTE
jgi:hypothetical protein